MQLSAQKTTLASLFGTMGRQFVVPPYQRPYAWGDDNIDDLWNDLIQGLDVGHFMGSVVVANDDEDRPQVIDGQQRLTSIAILLAQIRDRYSELGFNDNAAAVQQLLVSDSLADDDSKWRLRVGDANWKVFRNLVLRPLWDEGRLLLKEVSSLSTLEQARNDRVIANTRRLYDHMAGFLGDASPETQHDMLRRLHRTIVQKLEFVAIEVGSLADAFLLFETLNDRGLALSAADLLKNHLMARTSAANVPAVGLEWDGMLTDLGPTVDVTTFFRHYLLLYHKDVRKETVYDLFKQQIAKVGVDASLEELRLYARYYGQFVNPSLLSKDEAQVAAVLRDLSTLKATSSYVLLLAARRYLSTSDFVRLARACEVVMFRASSVLNANAQSLQYLFVRAAVVLSESAGARLPEVYESLRQENPGSELFLAGFRRQRLGAQYLAKYMLGKIEDHLSPTSEVAVQYGEGRKVHLEHILPQTLTNDWAGALGDGGRDHLEMVGRWGNLTLLDAGLNIKASNNSFSKKQADAYQFSVLALNGPLKTGPTWNYVKIDERQAWLAKIADGLWNLDRVLGHASSTEHRHLRTSGEPTALDLAVNLPPSLLAVFAPMCHETSYETLLDLRSTIDAHLSQVRASNPRLDAGTTTATRIHAALTSLLELSEAMDARERRLLRGAIEYYALTEDVDTAVTGDDRLEFERVVVDAVCHAVGFPDLAGERT